MEQARLSRLLIWVGALVPVGLMAWIVMLHRVPAELQGRSIDLTGEWRRSPRDAPDLGALEVDDRGWGPVRLPAFAPTQKEPLWLRRSFEIPASLSGQGLTLVAGGLWPGIELWINGVKVAQGDLHTRGNKAEFFGLEAFEIPAERFRPGPNVIALRAEQLVLFDSQLFLAEQPLAREYVLDNVETKRALLGAALSLLMFFGVLLAAFLRGSDTAEERATYWAALHSVLGGAAYIAMAMNAPGLREQSKAHSLLTFISIFYVLGGTVEFIDVYVLRKSTLFRRANRWISGGCVVLLTGAALAPDITVLFGVWGVLSAYTLVVMAGAAVNLVRGAFQSSSGYGPILMSVGALMVTGVTDTLTTLGFTSFPRLAPLAAGNLSIAFAVLIVTDFLRLSYINKELSSSLTTANQSLSVALAKAQESSRLKSEFVANVSHELRTPLNAIINIPDGLIALFAQQRRARCRSCSSLFELAPEELLDASTACASCGKTGTLEETPGWQLEGDSDEIVRQLGTLGRSGRHLLGLIDNVLDFSKLEAGRMTLSVEQIRVASTVNDVLESLGSLARRRQIVIKNLVAAETPDLTLRADPVKLSQILVNLVGNAVKFSKEQGTVLVSARRDGDRVELSVRDEGVGIPPGDQELIFESFRQVDGSHTRRFGGTGLGLAITKQLVELHGGRIWVQSQLDHGSTFFVSLPMSGPPQAASKGPALLPPPEATRLLGARAAGRDASPPPPGEPPRQTR